MNTPWHKSSFSTDTHNCLEVARGGAGILWRESDAPEMTLDTSQKVLAALIRAGKTGKLEDLG